MRVSSYIIATQLPHEDAFILMHGVSGAVDKVGAGIGRLLLDRRGHEVTTRDLAGAEIDDALLQRLRSRGYVTELEREAERGRLVRVADTLHQNDLATSTVGFIIVPTFTCNLRCPYCFQSHDMHRGQGDFARPMSREQVDATFHIMDDFKEPGAMAVALGLISRSEPRETPAPAPITLFGGEPLSAASLPIVPYIVEKAVASGRSVAAITNGVELDKFESLLGPGKIDDLQITFDGVAERHNQRRIGPGLHETFDTIVRNIELALSKGVMISIRINIDSKNVSDIDELDVFFRERGWYESRGFTAYAAAVTPEKQPSSSRSFPDDDTVLTQAELIDVTSCLREETGSRIDSYENWAEETLRSCLANEEYPFKRVAHCSAESGLFIFDPAWNVYACWEDVGTVSKRIGTYHDNGLRLIEDQATQWLSRFPGAIEDCSNCPYALIHTAGCASHARNSTDTLFASACETFQQYFPGSLAKAYEKFETELKKPAGAE